MNDDQRAAASTSLIDASGLSVRFKLGRSGFGPRRTLTAVNDVSLTVGHGETVGLVGESGSGKSTTGRAILRLVPLAGGSVEVDGQDISTLSGRELRRVRRDMQMVFQDPYSSLDPSMTVGESIAEPLRVHGGPRGGAGSARVEELLDSVGLARQHATRYPHEFSGGQRQRVAIARAIALNPRFLVCDEAVSALDVSTQSQVINLLEDLRQSHSLSYLFISHDLTVVQHIADRVAVMYLGRIVETGPSDRIFDQPAHPYTVALRDASPLPDPRRQRARTRMVISGDLPDPANPPKGCPFSSRCPHVMDVCRMTMPAARPAPGGGTVSCHLFDIEDVTADRTPITDGEQSDVTT
jgi:peptide/nickel transport system ATP-binding protein